MINTVNYLTGFYIVQIFSGMEQAKNNSVIKKYFKSKHMTIVRQN